MTAMRFLRAFSVLVVETWRQLEDGVGACTPTRFLRAFEIVVEVISRRGGSHAV